MRPYYLSCLLILVLALSATAQKRTVQIFVTSKAGTPVTDLRPEELEIREPAGARASVSSIANAPLCIGFLIDNSNSTKLIDKKKRQATLLEIEHLSKAMVRDGVARGFVLVFDSDLAMLEELTPDHAKLVASLGRLKPAGGTRMYDALMMAAGTLDRADCSRRLVLLVSDGEDNMSKGTLEDVVRANRVARVAVTALSTDEPLDYSTRSFQVLQKISRESGGMLIERSDLKSIKKALEALQASAGGAYLLQVERSPTNSKAKNDDSLKIRSLRDDTVVHAPRRLP